MIESNLYIEELIAVPKSDEGLRQFLEAAKQFYDRIKRIRSLPLPPDAQDRAILALEGAFQNRLITILQDPSSRWGR